MTGSTTTREQAPQAAGPMLMLGSALLFAVFDILLKILGPGFTVWDIGFYRFGAGLLGMTILLGIRKHQVEFHNRKLLVVRGITGGMAFLALVTAIRLIPLSTTMVMFYSFPAFAALFSALLFGETTSRTELICVATAVAGVAVIFDVRLEGAVAGQCIALVAGVLAGLTISIIKKLRDTNGSVVIYLFFCLMGTAICLPGFAANPHLPVTKVDGVILAAIAVTSMCGQLLMNQGFKFCRSWEGGLFLTSEVVFTALFGIGFLGERLTWRFGLGGLLIFASVIALNRRGTRSFSYRGIPAASRPAKAGEDGDTHRRPVETRP